MILATKLQSRSQSLRTWVAERPVGCKERCKNKTKHIYFVKQMKHVIMFSSIFLFNQWGAAFLKPRLRFLAIKKLWGNIFFWKMSNPVEPWSFRNWHFLLRKRNLQVLVIFGFAPHVSVLWHIPRCYQHWKVIKKQTMVVVYQVIGMMVAHNRGVWG